MMKRTQQGFTLIELVMVIVILGILAATAIPRFVNLSDQAGQAATDGLAGSISSAFAINYAAVSANNPDMVDLGGDAELCDLASANSVLAAPLPGGYTVTNGTLDCSAVATVSGTSVTCQLTGPDAHTANYTAICAKP